MSGALISKRRRVMLKPADGANARAWPRYGVVVAALAILALGASAARAQKPNRHKILGPGGPNQQEFNGSVQSLNLKDEVLNVHSLRDDDVEIFPIKKTTEVLTANGERMDLEKLQPGANVLVYYEQKGDRRTVKQVVVLRGPQEQKKEEKPAPPS